MCTINFQIFAGLAFTGIIRLKCYIKKKQSALELFDSMVNEMNRQDIGAFDNSDFTLKNSFRPANSKAF